MFQTDENERVEAILDSSGAVCAQDDLNRDATLWAHHFANDTRNNHCSNHEHDCKETCVKYVKKKLEAKESLRSNKVPSCRFWFFRIVELLLHPGVRRVRRRGKPLVKEPYIEEDEDRNDQHRCKVIRDQPFRSTSNDVSQASDRCNVDYQFLPCPPLLPSDVEDANEDHDASQLVGREARQQGDAHAAYSCKWLYGCSLKKLGSMGQAIVQSFAAAFRKQYAMDFYITKYQGKMMQSLTPLFQTMQDGIHRLQQEEEEAEKQQKEDGALREASSASEPTTAVKKRKTQAEVARKARRVCIRLASMANRCYWLSATEIAVHIITGGDCLQSHKNQRLFTRQLQWALQECKRSLNKEGEPEEQAHGNPGIEAVGVKIRSQRGAPQPAAEHEVPQVEQAEEHEQHVVIETVPCTTSTNTTDDYSHRGASLQSMPFYVYRMFVRRVSKHDSASFAGAHWFNFVPHYPLAVTCVQVVKLTRADVPTIDGFQCPPWHQDPEQNALLKHVLFTPWACDDPMNCGSVTKLHGKVRNCLVCQMPGSARGPKWGPVVYSVRGLVGPKVFYGPFFFWCTDDESHEPIGPFAP